MSQQLSTTFSSDSCETLRQLFTLAEKLAKPFEKAGAARMVGSGMPGGFIIPAIGLPGVDLLEEAGPSPLNVLQMTALNGAKLLGSESNLGSVAHPLTSIQSLRRASGVVRDGTHHFADALAALKQKTADRVAAGACRN